MPCRPILLQTDKKQLNVAQRRRRIKSVVITMAANNLIITVLVALVIVISLASSTTSLTFNQGGYNQLQVALAPQTPVPSNCSQMLNQLEVSAIKFVATLLKYRHCLVGETIPNLLRNHREEKRKRRYPSVDLLPIMQVPVSSSRLGFFFPSFVPF